MINRGLWALCISMVVLPILTASAQNGATQLRYEIASVRPSDPTVDDGSVQPLPNGVGYNALGVTVRDMLSVMYRIPQRQFTGGPDWVYSKRFDVMGRADHTYSIDELHAMFENLLADRFNLKLQFVQEPGSVYMLRVAKSGLKMTAVDAGTDRHSPILGTDEGVTGDRVPLNYLCWWLGQNLQSDQRPVVDGTGLTGTYNFKLRFRPPSGPSAEDNGTDTEDLPSIFQALHDQLGLELTPEKGTVTKVVIEHIDPPSEN